jgi:hypothetical protein
MLALVVLVAQPEVMEGILGSMELPPHWATLLLAQPVLEPVVEISHLLVVLASIRQPVEFCIMEEAQPLVVRADQPDRTETAVTRPLTGPWAREADRAAVLRMAAEMARRPRLQPAQMEPTGILGSEKAPVVLPPRMADQVILAAVVAAAGMVQRSVGLEVATSIGISNMVALRAQVAQDS